MIIPFPARPDHEWPTLPRYLATVSARPLAESQHWLACEINRIQMQEGAQGLARLDLLEAMARRGVQQ